jgi:predicted nucleotidyltransferase
VTDRLHRADPACMDLDRAASEQRDRVVTLVEQAISDELLGIALHGSAVASGLQPSSDLDVLVVVTRATSPAQKRRLIAGLLPISGSRAAGGPARSIELTIVVQSSVRPWRYPPEVDFQYGDWMRTEFEQGDLAPWKAPNPDLAVLLTAALQDSRSLRGRPIVELVDPVPRGDLVRAMVDELPSLLDDLIDDTRNVVLTLARIWTTLETGEIRSKDAAADWVLERLPVEHRAVLERARAAYLGTGSDRWDELRPAVSAHATWVATQIRRLVDGPALPMPAP